MTLYHAESAFLHFFRAEGLPEKIIRHDGTTLSYLGSLRTPGSTKTQHYYAAGSLEAFFCYSTPEGGLPPDADSRPTLVFRADDMKVRCRSIIREMNRISPDHKPFWSSKYV